MKLKDDYKGNAETMKDGRERERERERGRQKERDDSKEIAFDVKAHQRL